MPKITPICYLSSLLFYGMGYLKTLVIKNAVTEHIYTYEYTNHVSLATSYFVLAIFFAVIGSLFFYFKIDSGESISVKDIPIRVKVGRGSQSEYGLDFNRRMSS